MEQIVYLVSHIHELGNDRDDEKIIGVYSSYSAALAAVERLRKQPGFCETPLLRHPSDDEEGGEIEGDDGFYIDKYIIDEDHWEEGFVTVY